MQDAGVVHQDVRSASCCLLVVESDIDRARIIQADTKRRDIKTATAERLRRLGARLELACTYKYCETELRELLGYR